MIDCARHYYPVAFIKHVLDSMVASKLNVLHVHFTARQRRFERRIHQTLHRWIMHSKFALGQDDQSFPVESALYPKLSGAGAFTAPNGTALTYSHADLDELVGYAEARGVLLVRGRPCFERWPPSDE